MQTDRKESHSVVLVSELRGASGIFFLAQPITHISIPLKMFLYQPE